MPVWTTPVAFWPSNVKPLSALRASPLGWVTLSPYSLPARWSPSARSPAGTSGSECGAAGRKTASSDELVCKVAGWRRWRHGHGFGEKCRVRVGAPVKAQHLGQIRRLDPNDMPDLVLYRRPKPLPPCRRGVPVSGGRSVRGGSGAVPCGLCLPSPLIFLERPRQDSNLRTRFRKAKRRRKRRSRTVPNRTFTAGQRSHDGGGRKQPDPDSSRVVGTFVGTH